MSKYEVRFEIDVEAASPEQAAITARDMLFDPDVPLMADVRAFEYCEEAEDWFPTQDPGWCADFRDGGVRPNIVFAIKTLRP